MNLEKQKYNFLIVDDQLDIIELMHEILLDHGFTSILTTTNSVEVLDTLESSHGTKDAIDILILDHYMPELTGEDLAKKIRSVEKFNDIQILMVTGQISFEVALLSGANDYLSKPFTVEVFQRKINALIQMRTQSEENIQFLPIRCSTLAIDSKLPFSCFHFEHERFRLLLEESDIFSKSHRDTLSKFDVKKLFIQDIDEVTYQNYLDQKIQVLTKDPEIDSTEKSEMLLNYGSLVLEEAFKEPIKDTSEKILKLSDLLSIFFEDSNHRELHIFLNTESNEAVYSHSLRVASIVMLIVRKILAFEKDALCEHHHLIIPFKGVFKDEVGENQFKVMMDAAFFHEAVLVSANNSEAIDCFQNPQILEIINQHQEFCDGSGTPFGLVRHKILNFSKILCIANFYDNEVFASRSTPLEGIQVLENNKEKFMPQLIAIMTIILKGE